MPTKDWAASDGVCEKQPFLVRQACPEPAEGLNTNATRPFTLSLSQGDYHGIESSHILYTLGLGDGKASLPAQGGRLVGALPRQVQVLPSKVAVGRRLLVNWTAQV